MKTHTKEQIETFLNNWGQNHYELCGCLDYDVNDSEDLILVDYFYYGNLWIPINSILYTNKEQKIADYLKEI